MRAINIQWEVDSEKDFESLPEEIEIPSDINEEEEICEYISDLTGFLHKGFDLINDL